MGLLDDAIREHLELKRLHGADASEVEKLEQEAFGPVRSPDALEVGPATQVTPEEHEVALEEEHAYEDSMLEAGEDPEPAPLGSVSVDAAIQEQAEAAAEGEAGPGETVAFSLQDVEEAQRTPPREGGVDAEVVPGDAGADDELEETPEFLQETPEHDRLWFEQKPPKDFDF